MQAASLQAEQKALALFRSWLSPGHTQEYNFHNHFEVIGSDTDTLPHPARKDTTSMNSFRWQQGL